MSDIKARVVLDGENQFKQGIKSISTEMKAFQSEVKAVEAQMKNQGATQELLTKKQEALTKAQESAKRLQEQLSKAIESANKKYEDAKKVADQHRKALDDAKKSGTASAEELAKLTKAVTDSERAERAALSTLNSYETQQSKCTITLEGLNAQINQNERQLQAVKDPYGDAAEAAGKFADEGGKAGDAVTAMAEAIASSELSNRVAEIRDALLDCIDAANAYGLAIAKVSTLTGGEDITGISDGILEMSNRLGVSSTELAESMYQALSASVDVKNALGFVDTATRLAVGGFTDASTAVDVLTTIINAYGMKASDAARISDILVGTQNKGKTTVQQLGQSLGQVIPLAATYNVNLSNLATAYVQMTKAGINTANATTYIRAAMQELGDSGSSVSEILYELTGKNFSQLSAQGYSLGDIMGMLSDAVNNDATAFANLWGNQRAGLGAMSIVNAGTEEYAKTMQELNTEMGVAEENFQKIANTSEKAGTRLTNSLENLKIAIGQELQEPLDNVKSGLTGIVEGVTTWVKENPQVVKVIGALVTALTILAGTMTAYVTITKLAEVATKAFSTAVGGSVVGKIVLAVTAIVAAITALYAVFGKLQDESGRLADDAANLAKEHEKAADEYAESADKYRRSMKTAETETERAEVATEAYNAALERRKQILAENQEAEENLEIATNAGADAEAALRRQLEEAEKAGADTSVIRAQLARVTENYNSAIEDSNKVLEENDRRLRQATVDSEYYYISLTETDEATKAVIDSTLAELDSLDKTSEKYQESVEALYAMTLAHEDYAATIQSDIDGINAEMENLRAEYDEAYNAAYNSLSGQFGLFEEVSVKTAQSVGDMINALKTQESYMETYSQNLAKAIELGLSDSLVQSLSDGSAESAAILQSIVEDGGANIQALNDQFEKVEEGKKAFSQQLAETQTDFNNRMSGLEERLSTAVGKMNQANQAYQNAVNTVQGYINGTRAMTDRVVAEYVNLANAANNAYKRTLDQHSPSRVFERNAEDTVEGAIIGTKKKAPELAKTYGELAAESAGAYAGALTVPSMGSIITAQKPTVQVYLGDRELTNIMYTGIVRKIENTNRNASAAAGRK